LSKLGKSGILEIYYSKITMDKSLKYLEEVVRELYERYCQYPICNSIRYEVFVGEDDADDDEYALAAFHYREKALKQLKESGVIIDYVLEERSEETARAEYFSDWLTFKIASCLIDDVKLKEHIALLDQPKIYYEEATGTGKIKNKSFRLKKGSNDELLFSRLCKNVGKAIPRIDVLKITGFYSPEEKRQEHLKKDETYHINEIIKSLRKKTGLNTKSLANNNGDIILKGLILTLPQATPK